MCLRPLFFLLPTHSNRVALPSRRSHGLPHEPFLFKVLASRQEPAGLCRVGDSQIINIRAKPIVWGRPVFVLASDSQEEWQQTVTGENVAVIFFFFLGYRLRRTSTATAETEVLIKNRWEILGFASAPLMVLAVDIGFLAFHCLKLPCFSFFFFFFTRALDCFNL